MISKATALPVRAEETLSAKPHAQLRVEGDNVLFTRDDRTNWNTSCRTTVNVVGNSCTNCFTMAKGNRVNRS